MSKKNKGKNKKTVIPMVRLDSREFKNTIKNGHEDSLPDRVLLSKLFTPEISIVTDLSDEEKSLMKDGDSDTLIEFIISTNGVDRDGDTIAVDGWDLGNFHRNPVVPWAHKYDLPPVARAINTRVEDGTLKSKAMFTSKDLYPFGDMIGKMYKQKFLNAVSVGFNPSKFVFVEDLERKFGVDFLAQELLEYSAVPVPSNPEALIQARSKGIDINPMKEYLEILLDDNAQRKNLDMEVMDKLIKIFKTSTTTIGNTPANKGDSSDEDGENETDTQSTTDKDGNDIYLDFDDTGQDNDKDTDSLGSSQTEEGYQIADDMTLELIANYCKDLLHGADNNSIDNSIAHKELGRVLKDKYDIEIFDFKYVDSKVLRNFSERFNFDEEKCLLTEKTQKEIEQNIMDVNEEVIAKAINNIKSIDPDYKYKEKQEDLTFDIIDEEGLFDEPFNKGKKDTADDSDPENVIDLEGIENEEDLKSLLMNGIKKSVKTTFNSVTGKLN